MHISVLFDQLFDNHKRLIIYNFYFKLYWKDFLMLTSRKRMNRYVALLVQIFKITDYTSITDQ